MKVHLNFGESKLPVELPDPQVLEASALPALGNPVAAVEQALLHPLESPALAELARGKKSACVVVSDITRPVPHEVILPPILQTLEQCGLEPAQITILIATGMHRPNLGDELLALLGSEISTRYPVVNHFCREPEEVRRVGSLQIEALGCDAQGAPVKTPLELNRHYLDAELKILTGLIEPHFYAGFSGGCKSILPGISSFETMKAMHSFAMIQHRGVANTRLEGNPFHLAGLRAAELAGVDFIVNVVINRTRQVAGVFAGHHSCAHRAGCELVARHCIQEVEAPADLVVTSGGGYPLDATFYQISKALDGARQILRPGGAIVVACECREGLGGPEFSQILRTTHGPQGFSRHYSDPGSLVIDQWCAQSIYQALEHAGEVLIYSPGLSTEDLSLTGAQLVSDLQTTVDGLLPTHRRVVVVPDGPYVVGLGTCQPHR